MSDRVFTANRGEIPVRILDACSRLGLQTVLGVSAADRDSLGARRADRVVVLGGPRPGDTPGPVKRWRPPARGGLRFDSHVMEGYAFPPYYDALMGQHIADGDDRPCTVERLRTGLAEFEIAGLPTSTDLLERIVREPAFVSGDVTTHWLSDLLEDVR